MPDDAAGIGGLRDAAGQDGGRQRDFDLPAGVRRRGETVHHKSNTERKDIEWNA